MSRLAWVALICAATSCGLERTGHPLAVLRGEPRAICLGDDYQTPIVLSARDSAARALLPGMSADEGACLISLAWSVRGSAFDVVSGDLLCEPGCPNDPDEPVDCPIELAFPGDHGLTIVLTVTNEKGETDVAELPVALTLGGECEP